MKELSEMQLNIIRFLSDGLCHSGNELGLQCNVSRTAIWKQIKQLMELGIPIQCLYHQGYQLRTPIQLLNESIIRHYLTTQQFEHPIDFHLFTTIDSTNRFLKELPSHNIMQVCCAEMQTAGRGRFNRHWYSPFGENIYFSSRWQFNGDLSQLSGLSLVISLAILETLKNTSVQEEIYVKWPNDILWNTKKLCGNLIEVIAESHGHMDVIIGIGLNVNSCTNLFEGTPKSNLPEKPWCSLFEITGHALDRNLIIANLILQLNKHITLFMQEGFGAFIKKWHQVDYLQGKMITVSHTTGLVNGFAKGVNEIGQLILTDEQDKTHYLSSGDTSLQAFR